MTQKFITGKVHGLERGLTRFYPNRGDRVYRLCRSACPMPHPDLHHAIQDLSQLSHIKPALQALLPDMSCAALQITNSLNHDLRLNRGIFTNLRQFQAS